MPQLDSLLRIVAAQGADELRLGSDEAPSMFAAGIPKKLTIPLERSVAELVHRRQISVDAARAAGCDLEALSQYLQER